MISRGGKVNVRLDNLHQNSANGKFNFVDQPRYQNRISGSAVHNIGFSITKPVPQAYFDSKLTCRIKIEIWIRLRGDYQTDYCIVLDRVGAYGNDFLNLKWAVELEIGANGSTTGKSQQPMLVGIRKVTQDAQKGRGDGMFTDIRLKANDSLNDAGAEMPKTVLPFSKLVGVICDYKRETFYLGGRIAHRLILGDGINQVVKSTPQIVDAIPQDQSPTQVIGVRPMLHCDDDVAGIVTINLRDKCVTTTIYPRSDFVVDLCEVFFSANHLGVNAG